MANCLFCQIVEGDIPAKVVHQDDQFVAFHDIHPHAPVHLLLIPKDHVENLEAMATNPNMGNMIKLANDLGAKHSPELGHRVMVNSDKQAEIKHVHLHILGGLKPDEGIRQGGDSA